ncbi:expressed protein, partial [Aureococcus anophagefferens]
MVVGGRGVAALCSVVAAAAACAWSLRRPAAPPRAPGCPPVEALLVGGPGSAAASLAFHLSARVPDWPALACLAAAGDAAVDAALAGPIPVDLPDHFPRGSPPPLFLAAALTRLLLGEGPPGDAEAAWRCVAAAAAAGAPVDVALVAALLPPPEGLPAWLGAYGEAFALAAPQFYLGPPLSGAPAHFRAGQESEIPNFKASYLGRFPLATYATAPAFFAFREDAPGARTCVQRAGDVLFVPNNWGHAVLNLRTSVGVAAELSFLEL